MLDSAARVNKKYYPQTLLEECEYEEKNIKKDQLIDYDFDTSASYESDSDPDSESNYESEKSSKKSDNNESN